MKRLLRPLTPVLVILMMLTSVSVAVARTAPDATGQMVLCTGTGPVVIYLDETGAPVAPPHYCPDCALTLMAATAQATALAVRVVTASQVTFATDAQVFCSAPQVHGHARDPPRI